MPSHPFVINFVSEPFKFKVSSLPKSRSSTDSLGDLDAASFSIDSAKKYYDDFWQGTDKADKYSAKNGKSSLCIGWGGNDTLNGANKNDKLEGKNGHDTISGGSGNDTLQGHSGNDTLNGGGGNDELYGGDGNDLLQGGKGNDIFDGEDGNDVVIGGSGNDYFEADDGKKEWTGGKGKDTFEIDDDDDFFVRIKDFSKGDKLEIDKDYKGFEDFERKVVNGNMQITLDGDYVAELIGVTQLKNSSVIWD